MSRDMYVFGWKEDMEPNDEADDDGRIWLHDHDAVKHYDNGDMQDGFDIDLTKLPKDIVKIRVVNSW